jgi:hypothetical protein
MQRLKITRDEYTGPQSLPPEPDKR